jgi:hypothetical protein
MNRWLSTNNAIRIGWFLIGVGLLPLGCLLLWAYTHNSQPISEPIFLRRGQFVSRYFKPELNGTYQVSLSWLNKFPSRETKVDLDWEIVDSQGQVIDQGTYDSSLDGSNIVELGEYHPQQRVRQRIIVNVHREVNGPDGEARLEVGVPEVGLELAEGYFPLAIEWAGIVGGLAVVIFLVLLILRLVHSRAPGSASRHLHCQDSVRTQRGPRS